MIVRRVPRSAERAMGYRWDSVRRRHVDEPLLDARCIAAAGAINSTANDMAKWLQFQLATGRHGGEQLVSKRELRRTWRTVVFGGAGGYALGWMKGLWQRHQVVHHGGNLNGFTAQVGCGWPGT